VDSRRGGAELAGQPGARVRILGIAEDAAGQGLASDPLHDVPGAQAILGGQHVGDARDRGSGFARQSDQTRLRLHAGGVLALHRSAWVAPHNQLGAASGILDVERPQLLTCAAGETTEVDHLRPRAKVTPHQTRKPRADVRSGARIVQFG
jgi:hypothetical protein